MWVRVARIGKPFGIAGRVTVQVFTDDPAARFGVGEVVATTDRGADPRRIEWSGRVGPRWVLGLSGSPDRDAAEALRGTELYVHAAAETDDDEQWYDWQLVGLPCRLGDGTPVGVVTAVEHPPAQDLLVVATARGTHARVPFVTALVPHVDADGIVLDPPAGLLELADAE